MRLTANRRSAGARGFGGNLLLLDPGLLNRHGHHFHTDLAIHDECVARGIPVTVAGNCNVEQQISERVQVRPIFRATAYPSRDGDLDRDLCADFETFNRQTEEDLSESGFHPGAEDLVLIPTARDIHLSGMYRWYRSLAEPRPRVCMRLLFAPWFRTKEHEREMSIALAGEQLRQWVDIAGDRLTLVAERRRAADYFRGLSGAPVSVVPMPVLYPAGIGTTASSDEIHILFAGEARREKGFHLYPEAFARLLTSHPGVRLTVQASCLFDIEPATIDRLQSLSPRVSIVRRPLSADGYRRLLAASDAVLLVYDPEQYTLRTSQIFLEAAGAGKVVVTTRGTWMERQLSSFGVADVCVERFSVETVAEGLERMVNHWPSIRDQARQAAPKVRRMHNPASFFDRLLEVVAAPYAVC